MPDFEPAPDEPRLESWKAIASYLNRDVRTAKRWEVHEGLPVHRHRHLARSTVYVYPREIDLWREGRKQPAARLVPAGVERGRWLLLAAGLTMATLGAGGGRFTGPAEVAAQSGTLTATRLLWPDGDAPIPLGAVSFSGRYLAFNDGDGILQTRDLRSDQILPVQNTSGWREGGQVEFVRPSRRGDVIAYTWLDFTEGRYGLQDDRPCWRGAASVVRRRGPCLRDAIGVDARWRTSGRDRAGGREHGVAPAVAVLGGAADA